jgi:hypothetical protein
MWCSRCGSLKIVLFDNSKDDNIEKYCDDCFGIELKIGTIFEWLKIYKSNPSSKYKRFMDYSDKVSKVNSRDLHEVTEY